MQNQGNQQRGRKQSEPEKPMQGSGSSEPGKPENSIGVWQSRGRARIEVGGNKNQGNQNRREWQPKIGKHARWNWQSELEQLD